MCACAFVLCILCWPDYCLVWRTGLLACAAQHHPVSGGTKADQLLGLLLLLRPASVGCPLIERTQRPYCLKWLCIHPMCLYSMPDASPPSSFQCLTPRLSVFLVQNHLSPIVANEMPELANRNRGMYCPCNNRRGQTPETHWWFTACRRKLQAASTTCENQRLQTPVKRRPV